MELLFSVKLQGLSDKVEDAVVPAEDREGAYIGSAGGKVEGKKLSGTMRTSMFSENCPVPGMRKGAEPPKVFIFVQSIPVGLLRPKTAPVFDSTGKAMGSSVPKSTA